MTVTFGTKAETLERLATILKNAKVLPQIRFTVENWRWDQQSVLEEVTNRGWAEIPLVVRSSAINEDSFGQSMAGHYTSILNVTGTEKLIEAIAVVQKSFSNRDDRDQVFIQPMLIDVQVCGVAFSREPNTGGHYIVINYDDTTGSTCSVTSGETNETKTYYYFKQADIELKGRFHKVVSLIRELEELFAEDKLDIEFAISSTGDLFLFQVRPLVMPVTYEVDKSLQHKAIAGIYKKISDCNRVHPYLCGSKTVFGVMPDWNPAEMIGIRPRPLALSLYKELITDNIWAYQRDNYGYRNLRSFPLMLSFSGQPYIDVRVDFNSFIPADINYGLAEKLGNYYIDKLIELPMNHDKVEFEIIYTCYTLDLPKRLSSLSRHGFSIKEIKELQNSLRNLTNKIIGTDGLWRKDIEKIKELETRRKIIMDSSLDKVSKIFWLIEDCKRYGTLPFAGLARAGFIAVQLLKSLVNIRVITKDEYESFMRGLDTVSSKMSSDFNRLRKDAFLEKYGHLRPGTYDILSPRYDEEPDRYFNWDKVKKVRKNNAEPNFVLSLNQLNRIKNLLEEHGLEYDVLGLFSFIKAAIEGREYSKFVFTHSLSDILSLFKSLGEEFGYSVEECSYAEIEIISKMYDSDLDINELFDSSIETGKRHYELTKQIILPPVIVSPEDVWSFHLPAMEPNFITLKTAIGGIAYTDQDLSRLKGRILFIPSADPGYDWVFSHDIGGLVTMYGGVNSHMAIRAGELGIPSVIGAGELLYEKWKHAEVIELDCMNKQVRVIK